MATEFNPQIFQAAILEVAEATKAAVQLAQQVQQQQQPTVTASPSSSPSSFILSKYRLVEASEQAPTV